MSKLHLMSAAMIAATIVAGCGEKKDACEANEAAPCCADKSCGEKKDLNAIMVRVGDAKLTRGALEADLNKFLAVRGEQIPAEQLPYFKQQFAQQIAQRFLINAVLLSEAKKLGYKVTDEDMKQREEQYQKAVKDQPDAPKTLAEAAAKSPLGKERSLEELRNSVLFDKMMRGEISAKNKKDYTAEAKRMIEDVKAFNAKILSEEAALDKIMGLKKQLDAVAQDKRAEKFAELAKQFSGCPSGAQAGGKLGEFTHGQMVPEFDQAAFALNKGEISKPVKTQFGYHLILVTDKKAAVAAKGDEKAQPETCTASHILIKTDKPRQIPAQEELVKMLQERDDGMKIQEYILALVRKAPIILADEFKHLMPPAEEKPAEKPAVKPAEKPAEAKKAEKAIETPAKK